MSTAYLMRATVYLCGGFNGGTSEAYLKMAETIRTAVNVDFSNRIVARWTTSLTLIAIASTTRQREFCRPRFATLTRTTTDRRGHGFAVKHTPGELWLS